jgi:mannose-1-phosphate guanylyltransferase
MHFRTAGQPGTGVAILFSILKVALFDSSAIVGIFPSDHHFSEGVVYSKHIEYMFEAAEYFPERVVLLGIRPDRPETEYGWIEPLCQEHCRSMGSYFP